MNKNKGNRKALKELIIQSNYKFNYKAFKILKAKTRKKLKLITMMKRNTMITMRIVILITTMIILQLKEIKILVNQTRIK